jgi:hypothetical protein
MLLAVVVLFAVCWGPTLIDNVLREFDVVERLSPAPLKYVRQAFALMSYANSCANPVVYAFMSKNFRAGFRKTLGCARPCRTQNAPDVHWGGPDSPRMSGRSTRMGRQLHQLSCRPRSPSSATTVFISTAGADRFGVSVYGRNSPKVF